MPNQQASEDYEKLNGAVNEVFLGGRFNDRPVYLDPEGEVKNQLVEILGLGDGDLDEYVGCVVADSLTRQEPNIYSWHWEQAKKWSRGEGPPPFTALLLSFSIAAKHMRDDADYAPNNYYGRLAEVYGDPELRGHLSDSGKYMLPFWQHLNEWLVDNDYIYGIPTAEKISSYPYVSFSVSQALVREADRDSFHKLFAKYGLSSSDQVDDITIERQINDWMAGSEPSNYLKGIWGNASLREKIVTAAIQELESWDGIVAGALGPTVLSRRLFWTLRIKNMPVTKVLMYLCANVGSIGDLSLRAVPSQEHSGHERGAALELVELQGADACFVGPIDRVDRTMALLGNYRLVDSEGNYYERYPRPMVPFSAYGAGHYLREVAHVQLYEKYSVLCHDSWKKQVEEYLNAYSSNTYRRLEGASKGVPSGWSLFEGVEIVALPDAEIHKDLQDLVPIDRGGTLYVSGGLPLARDVWHKELPPSVFATDGDSSLTVKVFPPGTSKKPIHEEDDSTDNPGFLSTCGLELANSSYRLVAYSGNRPKHEKTISFRSANNPRRYAKGDEKILAYAFGDLFDSQIAVLQNTAGDAEQLLAGHVWLKGPPSSDGVSLGLDERVEGLPFVAAKNVEYEPVVVEPDYRDEVSEDKAIECIKNGCHTWAIPYGFSGKQKKEAIFHCGICGASILWKPVKLRQKQRSRQISPGTVNAIRVDLPAAHPTASQVFDAMCYQGFGSWASLHRLLDNIVDEPWKAFEKAKEFMDLGLVDLCLDASSGRPLSWSIPPPCLVQAYDGTYFLSGFRSGVLIENVSDVLGNLGGEFIDSSDAGIPNYCAWKGLPVSPEEIEVALLEVTDPNGRNVVVSSHLPQDLLSLLPSRREMLSRLPETTLPRSKLSRFTPRTTSWDKTASIRANSVYRFEGPPRKYYIVDRNDNVSYTTFELGKIQAAFLEGLRLHDYEASSESFVASLGCELPGLYRRALVACSGRLPVFGENNTIKYANVPKEVGNTLLNKLYG